VTVRIVFSAILSGAVPVLTIAASSLQGLVEQGDRLTQTDEGFPDSFTRAITLYDEAAALDPQNPLPAIRKARACLALGDWLPNGNLPWYERGEQAAERALNLKEDSAEAHFYLAANRGKVVNLRPFWKVSPLIVADLENHLLRALELEPRHARALHMMGILLERTPGPLRLLLAGKKDQVEDYLKRAMEADADRYAYIRWSLAEFYRDAGRTDQAGAQAQALLAMTHPVDRRMWVEEYRPAAEALIKNLAAP